MAAYVLNHVPRKSVSATPYELWHCRRPFFGSFMLIGFSWLCTQPNRKHGKLGLRAPKMMFIRYPKQSKGYVMFGKHHNGRTTEVDSCNAKFLEDELSSIGETKKDLKLYKL